MQIAKHETMRSVNTSALLQCLCENGPMTRNELQNKTGLSWGAVSNIVSELLALRVLCEKPIQSAHSGRKPFAVDVNRRENLCVGVDIHSQGVTCVITDIRGEALALLRRDSIADTRQGVIAQAVALVREAMKRADVDASALIGVGVSIQGSIDREKGVSLYSPHLPDWTDVPVCDIFRKEFGLPAILVHDTHAMLIAEQWRGMRGVRSLAYIRLDMGVGMAIFLNDRLYTGADGNASEFGHMIVDPEGPECTCGNHGCLEAMASGRRILGQVRQAAQEGKCALRLDGKEPLKDLMLVAQAAREGSAFEAGLFEEMGNYLGIGIANLVNMLNPELIVLGGMLSRYTDLYMDTTMACAKRNAWSANRLNLVLSSLDVDGAAVGAALQLIQQAENGGIPHPLGALFRSLRAPSI